MAAPMNIGPAMKPLGLISRTLNPTATYKVREYLWLPADMEHPSWDRRLGNLTIELWHGKGRSTKMECDTYAVEECPPEPGWMFRQFYLVNLTDPDQAEPYIVRIGRFNTCSCKAGRCRTPCKHIECLADLIIEGTIPQEYELPPRVVEAARWAADGIREPGPVQDADEDDDQGYTPEYDENYYERDGSWE
jgi:hypothetical protein